MENIATVMEAITHTIATLEGWGSIEGDKLAQLAFRSTEDPRPSLWYKSALMPAGKRGYQRTLIQEDCVNEAYGIIHRAVIWGTFDELYDELIAELRMIDEWRDAIGEIETDVPTSEELIDKYRELFYPYQVIICDDDECSTDVRLVEYFLTTAEARKRFDELKNEYDFRERDVMWLYEHRDSPMAWDGVWSGIDCYRK